MYKYSLPFKDKKTIRAMLVRNFQNQLVHSRTHGLGSMKSTVLLGSILAVQCKQPITTSSFYTERRQELKNVPRSQARFMCQHSNSTDKYVLILRFMKCKTFRGLNWQFYFLFLLFCTDCNKAEIKRQNFWKNKLWLRIN